MNESVTTNQRIGRDPSDMTARVVGFPEQLHEAYELAKDGPSLITRRPSRIYVVGMGGSAIGGDFVRAFAEQHSDVPVDVVRGYELPKAASGDAFALFVSYSGNTEETLAAWEQATARGLARAAITSGGELHARATSAGVPVLQIPGGAPPRSALGWTAIPSFAAMARAGLFALSDSDFAEAVEATREVVRTCGPDAGDGPLRTWAEGLVNQLPLIYAPDAAYRAVAVRWACQINENSKALAHYAFFPEHNHNEIVGWELDSTARRGVDVAFLVDDSVHPRIRRRLDLFEAQAKAAGRPVTRFAPPGRGLLARLFAFALMGDFASLYLAAKLDVDPTPVESIEQLKKALADPS